MNKLILFISFIGCCFAIFSQNQICVDGGSGNSGDGTPANPYNTIQKAIDNATNSDIIKVAKGTYSEAVQISQKKVQLLGGYTGSGDFNTANPQANVTVISGTNSAPCIFVYIDEAISGSLLINGFTICNGQRGIELQGGWSGKLDNITIENNIIENNGTSEPDQRGGGISLEGNNVTIQNNIIRNNKAGRGAAIGVTDNTTNFLIADNRIENNTGYDDHGGGVSIYGTGTITRNIFDGNIAAADPEITWGWGGALLIFADSETTTSVTLSHNVYRNNSAPDRGGAVFVDDGATVIMEHELIYNNTSGKSGAAIYVDAYTNIPSTLSMSNCTVANNANTGAALFVQGSVAHVENCIFWNNGSDFETYDDEVPAELTVNYTLTQQGFTGTENISSDPLFANATNGDFHVKSKAGRFDPQTGQFVNDNVNSPAIDAGNPTSDYSNEPQPNGNRVNLGRYGNTAEASKSEITGIIETDESQNITVYPNPTSGELRIESVDIRVESVDIFDIYGRKVATKFPSKNLEGWQPKADGVVFDISNLSAGIYFIKITTENGIVTKKVVKE